MLIKDQIGRSIEINHSPRRIVSLVPSITYTLSSFDMNDEVIGITRFCKYPAGWKKNKTIIGGTKQLKIDRLRNLNPDLILASKEENNKEEVEELSKEFPVYVSDVKNHQSNVNFIKDLGKILFKEKKAECLINKLTQKSNVLNTLDKNKNGIYLIWKNPWMTVGGDTFIHSMMEESGVKNIYKEKKRYPVIDMVDIKNNNPDILLLSSEPYPFKEIDKKELSKELPHTKIILVDGEAFSWFGTYPINAYEYFTHLKEVL